MRSCRWCTHLTCYRCLAGDGLPGSHHFGGHSCDRLHAVLDARVDDANWRWFRLASWLEVAGFRPQQIYKPVSSARTAAPVYRAAVVEVTTLIVRRRAAENTSNLLLHLTAYVWPIVTAAHAAPDSLVDGPQGAAKHGHLTYLLSSPPHAPDTLIKHGNECRDECQQQRR